MAKLEDTALGRARSVIANARSVMEESWDAWHAGLSGLGADDHPDCGDMDVESDENSVGMRLVVNFEPDCSAHRANDAVYAWTSSDGVMDLLRSWGVSEVRAFIDADVVVDVGGYEEGP
jgi:hypothetical protein